jgi:stage III sporulation protein AF
MNEWLKNLVSYLLIVSIGMQMLPNKKYEEYVRLFTGFLLIVILLQPILKIRSSDHLIEERINQFVEEQEMLETSVFEGEEKMVQIERIEEIQVEVRLDD